MIKSCSTTTTNVMLDERSRGMLKPSRTCGCMVHSIFKPRLPHAVHKHPPTNLLEAHQHPLAAPTRPKRHQHGRSYCLFRHLSSEASNTALYRRITIGLVKFSRKDAQEPNLSDGQAMGERWTLKVATRGASGTVFGRNSA